MEQAPLNPPASGTYEILNDAGDDVVDTLCELRLHGGGWTVLFMDDNTVDHGPGTVAAYHADLSDLASEANQVLFTLATSATNPTPRAGVTWAHFDAPGHWNDGFPGAQASRDVTAPMWLRGDTAPTPRTLRYGSRDFEDGTCGGAWKGAAAGDYGRICVDGSSAVFYSGFARAGGPHPQMCTSSDGVFNATECSEFAPLEIAVRHAPRSCLEYFLTMPHRVPSQEPVLLFPDGIDNPDTVSGVVDVCEFPWHCYDAAVSGDEVGLNCGGSCAPCPKSCMDILERDLGVGLGRPPSGLYEILNDAGDGVVDVLCEMSVLGGGWTVVDMETFENDLGPEGTPVAYDEPDISNLWGAANEALFTWASAADDPTPFENSSWVVFELPDAWKEQHPGLAINQDVNVLSREQGDTQPVRRNVRFGTGGFSGSSCASDWVEDESEGEEEYGRICVNQTSGPFVAGIHSADPDSCSSADQAMGDGVTGGDSTCSGELPLMIALRHAAPTCRALYEELPRQLPSADERLLWPNGLDSGDGVPTQCTDPDVFCFDGELSGDEIGVDCHGSCWRCPVSCMDILQRELANGQSAPASGFYEILGDSGNETLHVLCEHTVHDGGWTVVWTADGSPDIRYASDASEDDGVRYHRQLTKLTETADEVLLLFAQSPTDPTPAAATTWAHFLAPAEWRRAHPAATRGRDTNVWAWLSGDVRPRKHTVRYGSGAFDDGSCHGEWRFDGDTDATELRRGRICMPGTATPAVSGFMASDDSTVCVTSDQLFDDAKACGAGGGIFMLAMRHTPGTCREHFEALPHQLPSPLLRRMWPNSDIRELSKPTACMDLNETCADGVQNGDEVGTDCGGSCSPCAASCMELLQRSVSHGELPPPSGVYEILSDDSKSTIMVQCNHDVLGGGWTVVYRDIGEADLHRPGDSAPTYLPGLSHITERTNQALIYVASGVDDPTVPDWASWTALEAPTEWRSAFPGSTQPVDSAQLVLSSHDTEPQRRTVRFGSHDFDEDRCDSSWEYNVDVEDADLRVRGRLCIPETDAVFYRGFARAGETRCCDRSNRLARVGCDLQCNASFPYTLAFRSAPLGCRQLFDESPHLPSGSYWTWPDESSPADELAFPGHYFSSIVRPANCTRPDHCSNGVQDVEAGEAGVDCGGPCFTIARCASAVSAPPALAQPDMHASMWFPSPVSIHEFDAASAVEGAEVQLDDEFGYSVASCGGVVAVGAPAREVQGRVYVFTPDATVEGDLSAPWVLGAELSPPSLAPTTVARFGASLALSLAGRVLAVGAPSVSSGTGVVYIFSAELDAEGVKLEWGPSPVIVLDQDEDGAGPFSSGGGGAGFGSVVAFDDGDDATVQLAVASPRFSYDEDDTSDRTIGKISVLWRHPTTGAWIKHTELLGNALGSVASTTVGALAFPSANVLLYTRFDDGTNSSGSVIATVREQAGLTPTQELQSPTHWSKANRRFGAGLAASGRTLAVSSADADEFVEPEIWIFVANQDYTTWAAVHTITTAGLGDAGSLFGVNSAMAGAIALRGDLLAVGVPSMDTAGQRSSGGVLLWRRPDSWDPYSGWVSAGSLEPGTAVLDAQFGFSVALDDRTIAVGGFSSRVDSAVTQAGRVTVALLPDYEESVQESTGVTASRSVAPDPWPDLYPGNSLATVEAGGTVVMAMADLYDVDGATDTPVVRISVPIEPGDISSGWQDIQVLRGNATQGFGYSVALSVTFDNNFIILAVGAPFEDFTHAADGLQEEDGGVHMYFADARRKPYPVFYKVIRHTQNLPRFPWQPHQHLGVAVALDGDRMLIGSHFGEVWYCTKVGNEWRWINRRSLSNNLNGGRSVTAQNGYNNGFGFGVALSHMEDNQRTPIVIVSETRRNGNRGGVYLLWPRNANNLPGAWESRFLAPASLSVGALFGFSMSLRVTTHSGLLLAIGAPGYAAHTAGQGAVYIARVFSDSNVQSFDRFVQFHVPHVIVPDDPMEAQPRCGSGVAVHETEPVVAFSCPGEGVLNGGSGAIHFYRASNARDTSKAFVRLSGLRVTSSTHGPGTDPSRHEFLGMFGLGYSMSIVGQFVTALRVVVPFGRKRGVLDSFIAEIPGVVHVSAEPTGDVEDSLLTRLPPAVDALVSHGCTDTRTLGAECGLFVLAEGSHRMWSSLRLTHSLELRGDTDDARNVRLHGTRDGRVLLVNGLRVTLIDVSLEGRYSVDTAQQDGGLIAITGASEVLLVDSLLTAGIARRGGALFVSDQSSLVSLSNTFWENDAWSGGAVVATDGAHVQLIDNYFFNNTATLASGGALHVDEDAVVSLVGDATLMSNNAAAQNGGAIATGSGGSVLASAVRIVDNVAIHGMGGGVYIDASAETVEIVHTNVERCIAGQSGGGLAILGAQVSVVESVFSGCRAADTGGGVWIGSFGQAHIIGSLVENCSAVQAGGGLSCDVHGFVQINDAEFRHNVATSEGGAMRLLDCDARVNRTLFTRNAVFLPDDGCDDKLEWDCACERLWGCGQFNRSAVPAHLLPRGPNVTHPESTENSGGALMVRATSSDHPVWGRTQLEDIVAEDNFAPSGGAFAFVADLLDARCKADAAWCTYRPAHVPTPEWSRPYINVSTGTRVVSVLDTNATQPQWRPPDGMPWVTFLGGVDTHNNSAVRGADVLWVNRVPTGLAQAAVGTPGYASAPIRLVIDGSSAESRVRSRTTWKATAIRVVDVYGNPSIVSRGAVVRATAATDDSEAISATKVRVSQSNGTAVFEGLALRAPPRRFSKVWFTLEPPSGIPPVEWTIFVEGCRPGQEHHPNDNTLCVDCVIGKYNPTPDHDGRCLPCPPGTYQDEEGRHNCIPCPHGTYNSNEGSDRHSACVICPTRMTTLHVNSTDLSDCQSVAGHFVGDISDARWPPQLPSGFNRFNPTQCHAGMNCSSYGLWLSTVPLEPGFWRATTNDTDIRACWEPEFCLGGVGAGLSGFNGTQPPLCVVGHAGPLCQGCAHGWGLAAGAGSRCEACPADVAPVPLGTMFSFHYLFSCWCGALVIVLVGKRLDRQPMRARHHRWAHPVIKVPDPQNVTEENPTAEQEEAAEGGKSAGLTGGGGSGEAVEETGAEPEESKVTKDPDVETLPQVPDDDAAEPESKEQLHRKATFEALKIRRRIRDANRVHTLAAVASSVKAIGDIEIDCDVMDRFGRVGNVRYIGPVDGLPGGDWIGVHFAETHHLVDGSPIMQNDGSFGDRRYFSCPENQGSFVRPRNLKLVNGPEEHRKQLRLEDEKAQAQLEAELERERELARNREVVLQLRITKLEAEAALAVIIRLFRRMIAKAKEKRQNVAAEELAKKNATLLAAKMAEFRDARDRMEAVRSHMGTLEQLNGSNLSSKVKLLLSFLQVFLSFPVIFPHISYPKYFVDTANAFAFVARAYVFDIFKPSACLVRNDHYGRLFLATVGPLVICFWVSCFSVARDACARYRHYKRQRLLRREGLIGPDGKPIQRKHKRRRKPKAGTAVSAVKVVNKAEAKAAEADGVAAATPADAPDGAEVKRARGDVNESKKLGGARSPTGRGDGQEEQAAGATSTSTAEEVERLRRKLNPENYLPPPPTKPSNVDGPFMQLDSARLAVQINLCILLVVYPGVSALILQTFACETFADGQRFLRVDYTVSCDTEERTMWLAYAGGMAFIYPFGCVALVLTLLWRQRAVVNPLGYEGWRLWCRRAFKGLSATDKSGTAESVEHPFLEEATQRLRVDRALRQRAVRRDDIWHLAILWEEYEPHRWYWEAVEMARKLLLISIVVFVADGIAAQLVFALCIATLNIMLLIRLQPYVYGSDDRLSLVLSWSLVLGLFVSLMLYARVGGLSGVDPGLDSEVLDVLLMLLFGGALTFTAVYACQETVQQRYLAMRMKHPRAAVCSSIFIKAMCTRPKFSRLKGRRPPTISREAALKMKQMARKSKRSSGGREATLEKRRKAREEAKRKAIEAETARAAERKGKKASRGKDQWASSRRK